MKKPTKTQFGWTTNGHWINGDQDAYYDSLKAWENQPKGIGGRPATNPIHESWNEISKLFDSSSFYRSRRAFCRWANIHYATFSAMQRRPLKDETESLIKRWHWIGDGQGLDGSMNTNQDRMETTPKTSPMERGRIIYKQHRENGYAVPGLKKKKGVQNG